MLSPAPPSFENSSAKLSSLMTGFGVSAPRSDQVPQEIKHAFVPSSIGAAATADSVSCDATAITFA